MELKPVLADLLTGRTAADTETIWMVIILLGFSVAITVLIAIVFLAYTTCFLVHHALSDVELKSELYLLTQNYKLSSVLDSWESCVLESGPLGQLPKLKSKYKFLHQTILNSQMPPALARHI